MGASSEVGTGGSESYAKYYLNVSEDKEKKEIIFYSSSVNSENPSSFKWKNYEIRALYGDLKMLKVEIIQIN